MAGWLLAAWHGIKKLFGGKATMQIGNGNRSISGSSTGANSPVISAGRDVHFIMQGAEIPEGETELSEYAKQLLLGAAETDGVIMALLHTGGLSIQVGQKPLSTNAEPREQAKWRAAIEQLRLADLIRDDGYKGEIFRITDKGYQVADSLKN